MGAEGLLGSEHGVESDEELAHDCDDRLDGGFATSEEAVGEGFQGGIVVSSGHGRHKQTGSEVTVAVFGDAGFLHDGGSGGVLARIQTGVCDPLASVHIGW